MIMREEGQTANSIPRHWMMYLALILGISTRLFKLGSQSIWGDEALTLTRYAVGNGFLDVWRHTWEMAVHPPLYFSVVHYWFKLGQSEFMLRFPSVVFGVASIPVAYALANRLFGRRIAGLTSLVVALSPIHIWYSQEARMYSLQLLLGLASTLFLVRIWQEKKARDVLFYVVCIVLGLFTHMATAALFLAHGIFAIVVSIREWKTLAAWISVQSLIAATFLPWLLNLYHAKQATGSGLRVGSGSSHGIFDVLYGFFTFGTGFSLGPSNSELHAVNGARDILEYWPEVGASAIVFGVLFFVGMRQALRLNRWGFKLLMSVILVPTSIAGLASLLPGVALNPRYMLTAVIAYWMVLALGIQASIVNRYLRILPAAVAVLVVISLYNHYFVPRYAKQDMRSAVAVINREVREGDVLIISSIELGGPYVYYSRKKNVPRNGYPPGVGLVDAEKLPGDMKRIITGSDRAWLMLGRTWSSDPQGLIRQYFEDHYDRVEAERFNGVEVLCYELEDSSQKH